MDLRLIRALRLVRAGDVTYGEPYDGDVLESYEQHIINDSSTSLIGLTREDTDGVHRPPLA